MQWNNLRSGRHVFRDDQHEHGNGQQIGYHQGDTLARVRGEKERQQCQGYN